jgi:hypothetical protein
MVLPDVMRISFTGCLDDNVTIATDLGNSTYMCIDNKEIVVPSSNASFTLKITSDKHAV